jgi:hypothetical protein
VELGVAPTQLEGVSTAVKKAVLAEWIDFFRGGPSNILHLGIFSRVTQPLLDSLAGQTQLSSLSLKWGPYSDLRPLSKLRSLTDLSLGGAKKVVDLGPLTKLKSLTALTVDQSHEVADFAPLGELTRLQSLSIGNGYPGSDRVLPIEHLDWIRSLQNLTSLDLPGTRLDATLFDVILELRRLQHLRIPLRHRYRAKVFALADTSHAFAEVAQEYLGFDKLREEWGLR